MSEPTPQALLLRVIALLERIETNAEAFRDEMRERLDEVLLGAAGPVECEIEVEPDETVRSA